jgi:DNA-binding transcriptional LysR family regulator
VAEERHFGRAALALGLPQPTVSRHVHDLETELGVTLLQRTSRSTTLTAAGEVVLEQGRRLLDDVQQLRDAADHAARQERGEVTVGFLSSTVTSFLTPLLQHVAAHHPDVQVRVTQLLVGDMAAAVRDGGVDVGIGRGLGPAPDVVARTLVVEPMVVAVPRGHRWARRRRLTRAELRDQPLILLEPRLWPAGLRANMQRPGAPEVARHAPSHASAVALVAAGAGVYPLAASATVARDDVRYVELVDGDSAVLLVRRAAPASAAIDAIVAAATEVAATITFTVPGLPPLAPRDRG